MPAQNRSKIIESLNELARQRADPKHAEAFFAEITGAKGDRGPAILLATNVEVALDSALRGAMVENRDKILLRPQGACSDFRNKIHVGYGFGVFGEQTFETLELIRAIRNAFAHAQIPISFEMPELQAACALLHLPNFIPPHTVGSNDIDVSELTGLDRYRAACERVGHNLYVMHWNGVTYLTEQAIQSEHMRKLAPFQIHLILRN